MPDEPSEPACASIKSLALAWKLGRRSDRGVLVHLIYWAEACVLYKWMSESGVQHLHAHYGTNTAAIAMLSSVLGGIPFSFTAHGPEEFDSPKALSLGEKISRAAFVVAVSEFGKSQLCRWCGYEQWAKIHVVRCGVDSQYLESARVPVPLAES